MSVQHSSHFPEIRAVCTHLEPIQRRADICPHLVPLDDEATVLGVPTHGPGARALVEALVDVLGREAQSAIAQRLEDAGGLHFRGVDGMRKSGGGGGAGGGGESSRSVIAECGSRSGCREILRRCHGRPNPRQAGDGPLGRQEPTRKAHPRQPHYVTSRSPLTAQKSSNFPAEN